jgi:hypothetical protein
MTRNRLIAGLAGALLGLMASAASAQNYTLPTVSSVGSADAVSNFPGGVSTPTSHYASVLQMRSFYLGQNSTHTAAPTLTTSSSTCGGSTATVAGTDVSGQIAEGSSASTSCVATFAKAFTTAPECFVSIDNVTDSSLKCATSTTALTITKSSAASEKINYLVVGVPGG